MTLDWYEQQIAALERCEIGEPEHNWYPSGPRTRKLVDQGRTWDSDQQEACVRLSRLSGEIRRIAWRGEWRSVARALADRADASGARLASEAGLAGYAREPRFPAFYSGGILCPAID